MKYNIASLLLITLLLAGCDGCKDDEMMPMDPDLPEIEIIENQDFVLVTNPAGTYAALIDSLLRPEPGQDSSFLDARVCSCDSSLILLASNVNIDPNDRRNDGEAELSENGGGGEFTHNFNFRVGPVDNLTPGNPPPVTGIDAGTNTGPNVVDVAIVDSGIDLLHSALFNVKWINEDEDPYDGIDNDGCLVDDFIGYDFGNDTSLPTDSTGHGTHIAGIIALNPPDPLKINVMSVKITSGFLNGGGKANLFDALCGIKYAIRHEIPIINLSWGYYSDEMHPALFQVLKEAEAAGLLVIASAGNDAVDTDEYEHWPSGFARDPNLTNVISVAGLNTAEDELGAYSNFGSTSIFLAAAGEEVNSTFLDDQYRELTGTSMAAGFVSREAACAKNLNPQASVEDLRDAVLNRIENLDDPRLSTEGKIIYSNSCQ